MMKHFVGTDTNTAGDYYFTLINENLAFNIMNDKNFQRISELFFSNFCENLKLAFFFVKRFKQTNMSI